MNTFTSQRFWLLVGRLFLLASICLGSQGTIAAKGGNGGGGGKPGGGGGDPVPTCDNEVFPDFVYVAEGGRKSPPSISLAGSDACQLVPLAEVPDLRGAPALHKRYDAAGVVNGGVIIWAEEPGDAHHFVLQRLDFFLDSMGDWSFGSPYELALDSDDPPVADERYYFGADLWGDGDSTYLSVQHVYVDNSNVTPITSKELRIYNLNNLNSYQLVSQSSTCTIGEFSYPEMVPACYELGYITWSPSGKGLYIAGGADGSDGNRWYGLLRVDISPTGSNPTQWSLGDAKLVYTDARLSGQDFDEPSGSAVRPGGGTGEYIAMSYLDRTGNNTVNVGAVLDVDQCIGIYAAYEDGGTNYVPGGSSPANSDLWLDCINSNSVPADFMYDIPRRINTWQSADALLTSQLQKKGNTHIYRVYVAGQRISDQELLIENAEMADTGN